MKTKRESSRKPKTKNTAATRARKRTAKRSVPRYALRLYITGQTPRSRQSVENLRALCDKYIPGQFDLEVVDIYQQPAMAAAGQIIAAPTLIKSMPLPLRRLVGDFSDQSRVILGLDIKLDEEPGSA
jgi:circadian clock protein KaiB